MPRLNSGSRRRPPESFPAAPSRRGFPRHVFPFRRLAALAGGFRRSLPAAVLLALVALVPVLPISSAVAQEVVEVPRNSPLKPSGLAAAQKEFRLLFVTSTRRNAISTDIADYNSFVQGSAAAGHSSIRPFASQFRVVGSTGSVDARDNTSTTYTSSDKGVPIYWVRGNKVADEYEDFYDGGWDDERNVRDERGNGHSRLGPLRGGGIWTGSSNDGTAHASDPLGGSVPGSFAPVRQGRLGGSSPSSRTPLSHQTGSNTAVLGFYALSPVIRLVDLVEVTGVSMQSSPASGDTYAAEETITVRLTFTEAVNVTGRPFVYLNVGGALGKAVYAAGWRHGTALADDIFAADLERLNRVFEGLVLWRRANLAGMVTAPALENERVAVSGHEGLMRIDETVASIGESARFELRPRRWTPRPEGDDPSAGNASSASESLRPEARHEPLLGGCGLRVSGRRPRLLPAVGGGMRRL